MRNRSHILDQADVQSGQLERPQGRVSPGARSPNKDLHGTHAMVHSLLGSAIGGQLREKQKVKRMYGLMEKQFRGTFALAEKAKGITGEALLVLLERRLDNVTYRLGFASSRSDARMLIRHGHILVNGRRLSIPSYFVRAGDAVSIREKSRNIGRIVSAMDGAQRRGVPEWAELDRDAYTGRVKALPTRTEITATINEKLIVELYSK